MIEVKTVIKNGNKQGFSIKMDGLGFDIHKELVAALVAYLCRFPGREKAALELIKTDVMDQLASNTKVEIDATNLQKILRDL